MIALTFFWQHSYATRMPFTWQKTLPLLMNYFLHVNFNLRWTEGREALWTWQPPNDTHGYDYILSCEVIL